MKSFPTAVAAVILGGMLALGAASAANATDPSTYPTLPQPGPGQRVAQEFYSSFIYPCNSGQLDHRITIDQAITQVINGENYTVSHGRYVKDNYTSASLPAGAQCGVILSPPPAEYPLPSDFPPPAPTANHLSSNPLKVATPQAATASASVPAPASAPVAAVAVSATSAPALKTVAPSAAAPAQVGLRPVSSRWELYRAF